MTTDNPTAPKGSGGPPCPQCKWPSEKAERVPAWKCGMCGCLFRRRADESEPAPPTDGPRFMTRTAEEWHAAFMESRAEVEMLRAHADELAWKYGDAERQKLALRDRVRVLEAENAGLRHSRDRLSVMFDEMVEERDRALAGPPERES